MSENSQFSHTLFQGGRTQPSPSLMIHGEIKTTLQCLHSTHTPGKMLNLAFSGDAFMYFPDRLPPASGE